MNYEVEVLIKDSPRQVDTFVVDVPNEQHAKMMALDLAHKKWGAAKQALSVKQAGTGFVSVVKGGDAPIVGKDPGYFFTDTDRSSMGLYEVLMQIKKGPPQQTELLDIYQMSLNEAIAEATSESMKNRRAKLCGIFFGIGNLLYWRSPYPDNKYISPHIQRCYISGAELRGMDSALQSRSGRVNRALTLGTSGIFK